MMKVALVSRDRVSAIPASSMITNVDRPIRAVDLDAMPGGTRNADLLCTYEGGARQIEVKSSAGSPSERPDDEGPDEGPDDEGGALAESHR